MLANQTLISMDAGWYHVGEPAGGSYRGYDSLFTEFLPALRKAFSEKQINQLIIGNPREALDSLAARVRSGATTNGLPTTDEPIPAI